MGFEKIIGRLLKAEGGYTDDPDDKGGPTNWGIIQSELAAWRGHAVSKDDVKNLTLDEAIKIYKAKYWDKMGLDQLTDERLQLAIFDQGVNRGTVTAVKQAQQIANLFGAGITTDGVNGPVTSKKLNAIDPVNFCREFLQASEHAYVNIVIRNPTQIKFLRGWLNRVHNLQDEILVGKFAAELPKVPVPVDVPAEKPPVPKAEPGDYFGARWIGLDLDLLGRNETDPELNARYVPEWKNVGLPGYKTLIGNAHAWCAIRVSAVLRRSKVIVKGLNAAAASLSNYGRKCPFWFGALLDIVHRGGGRHACFFLYWIDEKKKIAATMDGNRGNLFCVARTDLSGSGDTLKNGPRWPTLEPDGQLVSMADVLAKYPHLKVGSSGTGTR